MKLLALRWCAVVVLAFAAQVVVLKDRAGRGKDDAIEGRCLCGTGRSTGSPK